MALTAALNATVIRILTHNVTGLRRKILAWPEVYSVTQLGEHLRVLLSRTVDDASGLIRRRLDSLDDNDEVKVVTANLEDVFVMSTRADRKQVT